MFSAVARARKYGSKSKMPLARDRGRRGTEAERVNSAESGLPGPTIDARGALLYIATPALSHPVFLSLCLPCLHHRGNRCRRRRPRLLPSSSSFPLSFGRPTSLCATGSPTGIAPDASRKTLSLREQRPISARHYRHARLLSCFTVVHHCLSLGV